MMPCCLNPDLVQIEVIDGRCKFRKGQRFSLAELIPKDQCVTAVHTSLPYGLTFEQGGWFRWEKDKRMVTALCPCIDTPVALDVKTNGRVCVHIRTKRGCRKYSDGDNFGIGCCNLLLSIYPIAFLDKVCVDASCSGCELGRIKVKITKGRDNPKEMCDFASIPEAIETVGWKRTCKYHKRKGQRFASERLLPYGMCPFAYHSAYPSALSLLYGGLCRKKPSVELWCPGHKNAIRMRVSASKRPLAAVFNLAEKAFRLLGIPQDMIDNNVKIEVIGAEGECPQGIAAGQSFDFNTSDRRELCPASFYGLLAFIVSGKGGTMRCPSEACAIRYRIKDVP
jgi:uncharacterized repeat protein (TIGR04076 family)